MLSEWHQSQQLRPHRKHAYPFGSYRAALAFLAVWQRDGASARSHSGSVQARAEETAKLGTAIQTTLRTDRDSLEIRRAELAADVRKCVERAFASAESRRGFSLAWCVLVVLDSVREEPVELEGDALSAQKHGRRAVQVELAAAELTPMPRSRRMVEDVERRLAELRMRRAG